MYIIHILTICTVNRMSSKKTSVWLLTYGNFAKRVYVGLHLYLEAASVWTQFGTTSNCSNCL